MSVISKIRNAIFMLINSPTSFCSRVIFETRSILSLPPQCVKKRINGILFEFDLGYTPATRNMFLGKYEIKERALMKKILHRGDTFIDVGASIGYLSAIGAGLVGQSGEVHCFEPVPESYQRLQELAVLNPDYTIITNPCALGEEEGTGQIDISIVTDIGLNTLVSGLMKPETRQQSIAVPVRRLDNYIKEHKLNNIALVKIDVEGFEFSVLKGLRDFFVRSHFLPSIICEITPSAYPLLDYQLSDLFDYMQDFSYYPFSLDNTDKKLDYSHIKNKPLINVLFKHIR